MKAVYNFVVTPIKNRYNNTKDIDGKELIVNTEIFNHQYVSREAVVKQHQLWVRQTLKLVTL